MRKLLIISLAIIMTLSTSAFTKGKLIKKPVAAPKPAAVASPIKKPAAAVKPEAVAKPAQTVAEGEVIPGTKKRAPYQSAIVIEAETGAVLFRDRENVVAYPASVTKLMTALLVLEDIAEKKYTFQSLAVCSSRAAAESPSKIDIKPGNSISIDDLLYALMIKSANDAAVILAEHSAGSVENFVERMNARAAKLGMRSTRYGSPNGLPPKRGRDGKLLRPFDSSTAADIAILARHLTRHHSALLKYTSVASHTLTVNETPLKIITHNHFLTDRDLRINGIDGLKTGYIDAGGSSIVLTGKRNGHRIIVVVLGSARAKMREEAAGHLMRDALDSYNF